MNHINLIIATPGHSVTSGYLRSLLAAITELDKRSITWAFAQEYASHVGDARELTLNNGGPHNPLERRPFRGEVTYDKILWIDSDIIFTPQDVIKAYESPYDIVSGAYLFATGEVVAYNEVAGPAMHMEEIKTWTEPRRILAAGMGFMAVKSGIFESLTRPWFQSKIVTINVGTESLTFPMLGEDLSFCYRANDLGYELWLDPSIKLIHEKSVKLTWEGMMP